MKKVIIGILIGIAICVICAIIYVKYFMFVPDKYGMINEEIKTYEDSVEFKCMTVRGWQEKISQYHNCDPKDIYCYYESSEFIAIVYDENYEEVAHYRFDDETGYALDSISGDVVDFLEGKAVEVNTTNGTTIKFNDNQCLAIGYVLDSNIDEFIHNNFYNNYTYNNLEVLDYRSADSREKEIENRFVIIPKSEDVKITLYSCFINEQGELELDNTLIKNYTTPFIILDDYLAETTTPELCIEFEYNGFHETFPIVFSGMDGKLDLTGVEEEVKDISVY